VLGLISGTSADGIDVALARIAGRPPHLRARLLDFCDFPFPAPVRAAILRIANVESTSSGEISQLNFLLGRLFARAALRALKRFGVSPRKVALIGSHGQTIYHQAAAGEFLGEKRVASTFQIGEPAVIAELTGIPTIGDFRPADLAAGGQGAPLVPFVDYLLFRHPRHGQAALNIGGIANVTVIPPAARPEQVFAFDTGPGNMLMDALARHFSGGKLSCDRDARLARSGLLLPGLLDELRRDPYLRRRPPKSCGREQYGQPCLERVLAWGQANQARPEDLLRTATVHTAMTIVDAFQRFVLPRTPIHRLIVSGGGAHNPLLMEQLRSGLAARGAGIEIVTSESLGVPEDAKEAFAFAILAYESFHRRPANLSSATGAKHPAVLGKLCLPYRQ
jgi:anhydro-N-acetylmuramic acid kinase